jgi:hypothetical protein
VGYLSSGLNPWTYKAWLPLPLAYRHPGEQGTQIPPLRESSSLCGMGLAILETQKAPKNACTV